MYFTWIKSYLVFMKDHATKEVISGLSNLAAGSFVLDQDPFYWVGKSDVNFKVEFSEKYALDKGNVVPACRVCKHRLRKLTSNCDGLCGYENSIKSFQKKKLTEFLVQQGWEEKTPRRFYGFAFPIGSNFITLLDKRKMKGVTFFEDRFTFPIWRFMKTGAFRECSKATVNYQPCQEDENLILISEEFGTYPDIKGYYWTEVAKNKVNYNIKRVLNSWRYGHPQQEPSFPYTYYSGYNQGRLKNISIVETLPDDLKKAEIFGGYKKIILYNYFRFQEENEIFLIEDSIIYKTAKK